jgi:hypothetical protein
MSEFWYPNMPFDNPLPPGGGGGGSGNGTLSGNGSPTGNVTPDFVGQIYVDVSHPGGLWVAESLSANGWRQMVG